MIDLGKTLVLVLGSEREGVANQLLSDLDPARYLIQTTLLTCEKEEILQWLMSYDRDPQLGDIVFVVTDEKSSLWFLSYKYDEKAALKIDLKSLEFSSPGACWSDVSELPSLIERLDRNVSEHANF